MLPRVSVVYSSDVEYFIQEVGGRLGNSFFFSNLKWAVVRRVQSILPSTYWSLLLYFESKAVIPETIIHLKRIIEIIQSFIHSPIFTKVLLLLSIIMGIRDVKRNTALSQLKAYWRKQTWKQTTKTVIITIKCTNNWQKNLKRTEGGATNWENYER